MMCHLKKLKCITRNQCVELRALESILSGDQNHGGGGFGDEDVFAFVAGVDFGFAEGEGAAGFENGAGGHDEVAASGAEIRDLDLAGYHVPVRGGQGVSGEAGDDVTEGGHHAAMQAAELLTVLFFQGHLAFYDSWFHRFNLKSYQVHEMVSLYLSPNPVGKVGILGLKAIHLSDYQCFRVLFGN